MTLCVDRLRRARDRLRRAFDEALAALDPSRLCRDAAARHPARPICLVAIGKAATGMAAGVVDALGEELIVGGLCITKEGHRRHALPRQVTVVESSHPIPDARSLAAGEALLAEVTGARDPIWFCLSGGASALAVLPAPGVTLEEKIQATRAQMAAGASIHELNAVRARLSAIKGGRLLARSPVPVRAFVLSDVIGDDLGTIGSGLALGAEAQVLAGPEDLARRAAAALGEVDVLEVGFAGTVEALAAKLVAFARAGTTAVVGGEPTIVLDAPGSGPPGRGGRAQHTAALVARGIAGLEGVAVFCAASDGTDGPTADAGAIIDGDTARRSGSDGGRAIAAFDAGSWLAAAGDLLTTGPTGNNLCDLYMVAPAR